MLIQTKAGRGGGGKGSSDFSRSEGLGLAVYSIHGGGGRQKRRGGENGGGREGGETEKMVVRASGCQCQICLYLAKNGRHLVC